MSTSRDISTPNIKITEATFVGMKKTMLAKLNHNRRGPIKKEADLKTLKHKPIIYIGSSNGEEYLGDYLISLHTELTKIFGPDNYEIHWFFHIEGDDAKAAYYKKHEEVLNSSLMAGRWQWVEQRRETPEYKALEIRYNAFLADPANAAISKSIEAALLKTALEYQKQQIKKGQGANFVLEEAINYFRKVGLDYALCMPESNDPESDEVTALFYTMKEPSLEIWKRIREYAHLFKRNQNRLTYVYYRSEVIENELEAAPPRQTSAPLPVPQFFPTENKIFNGGRQVDANSPRSWSPDNNFSLKGQTMETAIARAAIVAADTGFSKAICLIARSGVSPAERAAKSEEAAIFTFKAMKIRDALERQLAAAMKVQDVAPNDISQVGAVQENNEIAATKSTRRPRSDSAELIDPGNEVNHTTSRDSSSSSSSSSVSSTGSAETAMSAIEFTEQKVVEDSALRVVEAVGPFSAHGVSLPNIVFNFAEGAVKKNKLLDSQGVTKLSSHGY